jgi:hypothetical protein
MYFYHFSRFLVLLRREDRRLVQVLGLAKHCLDLRDVVDSLEVPDDAGVTSTLFLSHSVANAHLDGVRKVDIGDSDVFRDEERARGEMLLRGEESCMVGLNGLSISLDEDEPMVQEGEAGDALLRYMVLHLEGTSQELDDLAAPA